MTPTSDAPITVLYIAGSGRSGSTLLEYLIAERSGAFAIGEMVYLWDRGYQGNERCSCGQPFAQCPFWNGVLADTLGHGAAREERAAGLGAQQAHLLRYRRLPGLRNPRLQSSQYRAELASFTDAYVGLYDAVRERSGASVIVDSSKFAIYGQFLASDPRFDLRVVHLVRDSRAVAHSWQRVKRRVEASGGTDQFMPTFGARSAATIWLEDNLLVGGLRRRVRHSTLIRYEDLTQDPVGVVDRVVADLGLGGVLGDADSADGQAVRHSVSGNPARLATGPVEVSYDAAWMSEMDDRSRRLVTAMTAPALLRYGYELRPERP